MFQGKFSLKVSIFSLYRQAFAETAEKVFWKIQFPVLLLSRVLIWRKEQLGHACYFGMDDNLIIHC